MKNKSGSRCDGITDKYGSSRHTLRHRSTVNPAAKKHPSFELRDTDFDEHVKTRPRFY